MEFDFSTETITPENTGNITIGGTGGLILPVGTTAQRPGSPIPGMMRYNSDLNVFEHYNQSLVSWDQTNLTLPSQTGKAGRVLTTDGTTLSWNYTTYTSRNTAWAWGGNSQGQHGVGDTTNRSSPIQIGSLTNWSRLIANNLMSIGVDVQGRLWTWGQNTNGKLGLGDTTDRSSPTQVGSLTDWKEVVASGYSSHAIKKDGTLWAWGIGSYGQLGQNDTSHKSSPVQIGSLTDWAYIDGNFQIVAAIQKNGTLWTWGANVYGQLGLGDTTPRSSPTQVGSLTNWASISTGMTHMVAIKSDGTLWGWGNDSYGALAQPTVGHVSSPVQIGSFSDWRSVAAANGSTIGIRSNGTMWSWGNGNSGQLGDGTDITRSSPVQIGLLTDWLTVSGYNGTYHAVKKDGTLWAWGVNGSGKLGNENDTTTVSSPVQIGSLTNWSKANNAVGSGPNFTLGLQTNSDILPITSGGTGLDYQGVAGQLIGMAYDNMSFEYKTLKAGSGINVSHSAGNIIISTTLNDTAVAPHENGYENRTDSTISFNNGTRVFTIAPTSTSFSFWSGGVKFTKNSAQTVTLTNTTGTWYIYFDTAGVLQATQTFTESLITIYAFTSQIYWSAAASSQIFFGDERHGCTMDAHTHLYLHKTQHAKYDTGLALTGISVDQSGNTNSDSQFGVVNGVIWDEDIKHTITNGSPQTLTNPAQIPIYYRSGTTEWRKYTSSYPLIYGGVSGVGTRLNYNQDVSTNWQLTEVATGNCALVHYYATNSTETPIIGVCGQFEYTTVLDARLGAETELAALELGLFVTAEFVPIGSVIFQTSSAYSNTPKTRVRSTSDGETYVDWRATNVTTLGSNGTAWGTISGTLSNQTDLTTYLNTLVPDQTGNSGKYLTTNGTTTSWATISSGSGTVTSVAASTTTSGLTISGSPITTSGTLSINLSVAMQSLQDIIGIASSNAALLYWDGTEFVNANIGTQNKMCISDGSYITFTSTIPTGISLSSGTTTETTLKLTSGVQLTTPQAGAIEWDGTNLYLTQTTGPTRKTVLYSDFSNVSGTLPINRGGTNLTTTPTNGQLLIGNGTGYSLATLTQGSGVTITNGAGTITIASTGGSSNSTYDTEAWVVGRNTFGQLGLGDVTNRSSPIQIGADINWKQLSGGSLFTIGVKYDGTLWAWGLNTSGQLGDGTTTPKSSPVQIGSLTNWKQVSSGENHVVALKTDGSLWAWGDNGFGQLCDGTTTNRSSPVQVEASDTWRYVSAGNLATSLIKKDGSLWACGHNGVGQLGDGTTTSNSSPIQIGSLTNWKQVSMGGGFSTLAVKSDGTLWGWGFNSAGEVGVGTINPTSSPVQIGSMTDWNQVACGYQYTAAIKGNGTLWAWGLNTSGQLGDGTTTPKSSPVQIGSLTNWRQVTCGFRHVVARKVDGTGWSWGANTFGQLGDNTAIGKSSPVQISSNMYWTDISASYPGTPASFGATTYLLADSTPVTEINKGGTGLREIGIANQSLVVNPTGSGLEYKTLNNHGTAILNFGPTPGNNVTNVVVTGQTGITTNSFVNTRIQYDGPTGLTVGDGFNWTGKPHNIWPGPYSGSTCVAGGNGVYLVGNVNSVIAEIQKSTDGGTTWTSSYSNVSYGAITLLTYDSVTDTFYAVSEDGYIMSSTNSGTTWGTLYNISGLLFPTSIVINGTTIVITSTSGTICYTTTGISGTWSSTLFAAATYGSTFGNGLFVVVGATGSILTSPDGSTWTAQTSGLTLENNIQWTNDLFDVAYGNGVFVAVGMNGRCITSSNGINWTKQHSVFGNRPPISDITSIFNGTANKAFSLAFGNGVFVAVGTAGQIAKSLNGKEWIQVPKRQGFARFQNIERVERTGNNTFVIVSGQDIDLFATSSDLSLDHNMSEHRITPINTFISNITPDVGFTIEATSTYLLSGTYTVKWSWSN